MWCVWCVERHKVICLIFRVAALRIGKDCAVEFISSERLFARAVSNGRCEVALMVVGSVLSSGGGGVPLAESRDGDEKHTRRLDVM